MIDFYKGWAVCRVSPARMLHSGSWHLWLC
jgi:hypothetical protein